MTEKHNKLGRLFLARWIGIVCRHAWLVVLLALVAGGGSLYYAVTHVRIDARIDQMLSSKLPFRQAEIALKAALPKTRDTLAIVIEARTAEDADEAAQRLADRLAMYKNQFHDVLYTEGLPFFRRNGLLYLKLDKLEALSDRLAEAQPLLAAVASDPSLRGLANVFELAMDRADAKAVTALAPAINKMADAVDRLERGDTTPMSWRSLLAGNKAETLSERRKFIVVRPVRNLASLKPVGAAVERIESEAKRLGLTAENDISVRIIGNALMLQEELETVRNGIGFVGLLSFFLVLVLLLIGLRSIRLVAAAIVTLVLGLIWTAAFAVAIFGALNIISVAFAVLFIGLSVDFGIHFTLRYRESVANNSADQALQEAGQGVGGALFLSAVTAAFGFLSFLPTDYRGVSELGVISGVGMFIALFANLTVLPALIHLFPLTIARQPGKPFGAVRFDAFVKSHAGKITAAALVLGILGAASLPFAWFDDDPLNLRDPHSPAVATLLDVMHDPRAEPYGLEILAKDMKAAEDLKKRLEKIPTVESASTLLDLVPKNQDEKLAVIDNMAVVLTPVLHPATKRPPPDDSQRLIALGKLRGSLDKAGPSLAKSAKRLSDALDRLPAKPDSLLRLERVLVGGFDRMRDRLAEALRARPIDLKQIPAAVRERMLAADGRAIVNVKPAEDLRNPEARRRFARAVRAIAPNAVGPPVRFTAVGEAVIGAFQEAATIAFIVILALLFIVLRRAGDVAMVLAPIVLALLLTVASTVILDMPFNLANIIVLPLILGLGVAFGIQIVSRSRTEPSARLMETSTPRAVLFSALTTTGSFAALALSNHPGTASMGTLLTISIAFTLGCTLLVLPALLELRERQKGRTRRSGLQNADGVIFTTPEQLASELDRRRGGRPLAVFLDYDGTLTPIVARPELAVLGGDMRSIIRALASVHALAIVSGRERADVAGLAAIDGIYYAGSHGFDIGGPNGEALHQEGQDFIRSVREATTQLREALAPVNGAIIEPKTFSVAVHYRLLDADDMPKVRAAVDDVLRRHPELRETGGKRVIELRPRIEWDKGKAVLWLLEHFAKSGADPYPVYIGDDVTDEDAFAALTDTGLSVLVADADRPTHARYRLEDIDAVKRFLTVLLDERTT